MVASPGDGPRRPSGRPSRPVAATADGCRAGCEVPADAAHTSSEGHAEQHARARPVGRPRRARPASHRDDDGPADRSGLTSDVP